LEDIQKKLNTMVEDGEITQEEAEAKLKGLQTANVD
jgi:polyhydroxyalkanoate synthesis regulator phasin